MAQLIAWRFKGGDPATRDDYWTVSDFLGALNFTACGQFEPWTLESALAWLHRPDDWSGVPVDVECRIIAWQGALI